MFLQGKGSNISSYFILAMDDYDIVLLKKYPFNNKDELYALFAVVAMREIKD
jgi:hypothetical protein